MQKPALEPSVTTVRLVSPPGAFPIYEMRLGRADRDRIEREAMGVAIEHNVVEEYLERREYARCPLQVDLAMADDGAIEAATLHLL